MQTQRILSLSLVFLMVSSLLLGQKTFKNPIITGMNPDPSICRVGDDFYLVTSTFEYYPGLPIYKSKDLVNWKMIGYALDRPSNCPVSGAYSSGGNFAPALRYHNGTFYISCTNYGWAGSQGVFYVTAKNPEGPWSEPIWVGNWFVDPSMMFANDSMYWISPDNKGGFMVGTIDSETGKYIKPLEKVAGGLGGSAPEGPHMYKIGGYYYLMSAEGGTGYEHREVIQRSKSPYGPFEPSPNNPVLSNMHEPQSPFQAIGHADIVQLKDSSWWIVSLGFRPKGGKYHHLGRETFLAPLTWDENGWPKGGKNGVMLEEFPFPNLPEHKWAKDPVRDDFEKSKLNLCWNFIRNPYETDWSLSAHPGFLRLNGSKVSITEVNSPAFVGRRQTGFNMAASAKINFQPSANNEEAGLLLRGDDLNHFGLFITLRAGKKVALLRKFLQGKVVEERFVELPKSDVVLRVTATDLQYKFWAQPEGGNAIMVGTADTKDLSTEKISGFTGTFIGMYASGNGVACKSAADFDWFDYEDEPKVLYAWHEGSPKHLKKIETPMIEAISSVSHHEVQLSWKDIKKAKGYLIEKYINDAFVVIGKTKANETVYSDKDVVDKTMYIYRVRAIKGKRSSLPSIAVSVETLPAPGPFLSVPFVVPGRIEAERFDFGKEGETFFKKYKNVKDHLFRPEPVDVEKCWDKDGGYCIGGIGDGDWVVYSVDINEEVSEIQLRIGAWQPGGKVKLELDGKEIAIADVAPSNGYATVSVQNLKLEKGLNKKLKVIFRGEGFNFNWLEFKSGTSLGLKSGM